MRGGRGVAAPGRGEPSWGAKRIKEGCQPEPHGNFECELHLFIPPSGVQLETRLQGLSGSHMQESLAKGCGAREGCKFLGTSSSPSACSEWLQ